MKMTDKGKRLLELFKKVESEKSQDDILYQIETMVRAQEAIRADYGLVGPEATLFNGTVRDTAFIMPDAGPVMGAQA